MSNIVLRKNKAILRKLGETGANVKSPQMTFFKGMNYIRIEGGISTCETGVYPEYSVGSVGFDSNSPGSESRVWITLD